MAGSVPSGQPGITLADASQARSLPFRACHTCGLVHRLPRIPARHRARCTRCRSLLRTQPHPRSGSRSTALAVAALILYPAAILMPVMTLERLGQTSSASIWHGTIDLLSERHYGVGLTILLFSIVAPVGKLGALLALTLASGHFERKHKATTFRAVEWIGRWGMLDVLLVAVLVAAVKLGDLVSVTPGPGVIAFGAVVLLSLLASATFDPHAIWDPPPRGTTEKASNDGAASSKEGRP